MACIAENQITQYTDLNLCFTVVKNALQVFKSVLYVYDISLNSRFNLPSGYEVLSTAVVKGSE